MFHLIGNIVETYNDLMHNKSDPRVNDWFLMSSPFPTLLICLCYAYSVKYLGPKLMENRKPFNLKHVLIIYNLFQVLFSLYLFRESAVAGWLNHYSYKCQPVDYSRNHLAMRMANGCWWYFFSKFTEFFDTIFFVLRKKNDHISTLHVIHHGIMPMSVWFGVKFTPGGHSSFFGFLNTFVHIIMYTYYFIAALGPQYQRYLWWKKYLTTIQMIQFVLVMVHAFQLLFVDCNYPKAFVWWIGLHAVMFYFLFSSFYKDTYSGRKRRGAVTRNGDVIYSTTNDLTEQKQKNSGNVMKKMLVGICFTQQNALYERTDEIREITKGYTTESSNHRLRNRAFIDRNRKA